MYCFHGHDDWYYSSVILVNIYKLETQLRIVEIIADRRLNNEDSKFSF